MVHRDSLLNSFQSKSAHKHLFVTAPAGYGKTVAATQWLGFMDKPATILKARDQDNDPNVFYHRLAMALMKLAGKSPQTPALSLNALFCSVGQMPARHARCYLLLDDFHKIKNEDIINNLPLIVTHLPSYVRLCLIGRAAPPDALLETGRFEVLNQGDFLFTDEEIEWLGMEKGCALTKEQIRDLRKTTDGWAMYLSALLTGGADRQTAKIIARYFETQVWNTWDAGTKKLLLQLAVPEEITPELCERLTGEAEGRAVLDRLIKKENAYLSPNDDGSYRFHDIFRRFLTERSALLGDDELRLLNDIAARWYYEKNDYLASVFHYIQNRDHEGVNHFLATVYRYHEKNLSLEDRLSFIRQHIWELPLEVIAKDPYLITQVAIASHNDGNAEDFKRYIDLLRQKIPEISAYSPALTAIAVFLLGFDFRTPIRIYVNQVLEMTELLPKTGALGHEANLASITQNLPYFHRSMRDFSEYCELKDEDLERVAKILGVIIGKGYQIAKHSLIAGIHYERGELLDAARHALNGYCAREDGMHPETLFSSNMILAAILGAMGDHRDAERIIAETAGFVDEKARFLEPNFMAFKTEHALRFGDKSAAKEWLAVYGDRPERLPFYQIYRHFATLRSYLALGDFSKALEFGQRLQTLAHEYRRPLDEVESGILLALALWHTEKKHQAVIKMKKAMRTAAPYGFTQLFVNEGKEILPILWAMGENTGKSSTLKPFWEKLVSAITGFSVQEQSHLIRLSARRQKMLAYLQKGRSYSEIAAETRLARGTVKRHVLLLYKQLGVHSAEEAIAKAKMLGLL
ncbi:MAG: LuxR C-terminal-related transcriptional regulator [Lachnospiraceae bacterium]|jgi:LuxR family maltose regulon positive regulatory protein|nr:LuxR C-terminal-related transcriptional regulator [Lachnospiraceae bacterium]